MTIIPPHYYPIMLLKPGELAAISQVKRSLDKWYTPIFKVVPDNFWEFTYENKNGVKSRVIDENGKFKRKPKKYFDVIETLADKIHEHWRHEYPLMLDGELLTNNVEQHTSNHPINDIIEAVVNKQISIIPVIGLDPTTYNTNYKKAIQKRIQIDQKGVCLKIHMEDYLRSQLQQEIDDLLQFLTIDKKGVYLLLDFGYVPETTKFVDRVNQIPYLTKWKQVIIGSGSFPCYEEYKFKSNDSPRFPRHDLHSWIETVSNSELTHLRKFEFADFTCRSSAFTPLFDMKNQPAIKITWTLDEEYVHERGTQKKRGDNQFTSLAENLYVQDGVEEGLIVDICDADKFLHSIFEGVPANTKIPQDFPFWIGKSVEHHITLTILQMQEMADTG